MQKVAICIPTGDECKTDFALSLVQLVGYSMEQGIESHIMHWRCSNLPESRERLANFALNVDCSHVLWIDSDMVFPRWSLMRLLRLDKPIVCSSASTRSALPGRPACSVVPGQPLPEDDSSDELMEAGVVGFGFTLMRREVLEAIESPRFPIEWEASRDRYLGEDNGFCSKARAAGFKLWVDPVLTRYMGHAGNLIYMLRDPMDPTAARNLCWTAEEPRTHD